MYLCPLRLNFAGQFQADVSTVNNDVRHYDNAAFEPNFQDLGTKQNPNGWWNPTGSGAFRFVNCHVTSVGYVDGTTTEDHAADPIIGSRVDGARNRSAGKLVDIDPQWQLASAPWGLQVRLVAGDVELLRGEYKSHAFRDLWFSRNVGSNADGAASSTFQSVLEEVIVAPPHAMPSRSLAELAKAAGGGKLSIRLTTFGYDGSASSPTFTLGTMLGTIGPYLPGEPESFVLGRRFAPAAGFSSYGAGVTYFSGLLDGASQTLLLDLSNALQITDAHGTPNDIGTLSVGILSDETVVENTPVTADNLVPIGEIPYRQDNWLARTGGVAAFRLSPEQVDLASRRPLALVYDAPFNPGATGEADGFGVVAIRETAGGLLAGAEPMVVRIDANESADVTFRAARYGAPLSAQLSLRQLGSVPGQGAGTSNPQVDDIPIPDMGVPEAALTLPSSVAVEPGGTRVTVRGSDPGNPRKYLDGQVYLLDYRLPGQGNQSRQPFDFVVIHLRDAYEVPSQPTWSDIAPVMTQYGNLYPIMSQAFIDLGDEAAVAANHDLVALAFSAPMSDPNHMPVTRDLSGPKRQAILTWLASVTPPGEPAHDATLAAPQARGAGHRPVGRPAAPPPDPAREALSDSKSVFADTFLHAGRRSPTNS